jgi:hypothetical protein
MFFALISINNISPFNIGFMCIFFVNVLLRNENTEKIQLNIYLFIAYELLTIY